MGEYLKETLNKEYVILVSNDFRTKSWIDLSTR